MYKRILLIPVQIIVSTYLRTACMCCTRYDVLYVLYIESCFVIPALMQSNDVCVVPTPQEFLEAEEALLEREKRQLRAEALAVEQLMEGFKAAEGGNRMNKVS